MKIILKEDIENLGRKGDIVEVAPGYGRNYLIPKKLALEVTSSNLKMIEIEQQSLKRKIEQERLSYQQLIQNLSEVSLTFARKAGEKDVIFGSVGSSDIKEALSNIGFDVEKKKILLEEPIKRLGNYTVPVKVYHDDHAEIKVEVIKEEEAREKKEEEVREKKEEKTKEKEGKTEEKKEEKRKEKKREEEVRKKPVEGSKESGVDSKGQEKTDKVRKEKAVNSEKSETGEKS